MEHARLSLSSIAPEVLEAAWQFFDAMPSRARVLEEHVLDDQLRTALADFLGQPAWILAGIIEAALSERGRIEESQPTQDVAPRPVFKLERRYGNDTPQLVWSGKMGGRSGARSTRHVIADLFRSAKRNVFIAGYSFYRASALFDPLLARVQSLAEQDAPPLSIHIVLDCSSVKGITEPAKIYDATIAAFIQSCPQVRDLGARIECFAPSATREPNGRALSSMHAKCVVVDDESALVGSANFSNRGRDGRNLEVGALVRDANFVSVLLAAWRDVADQLVEVDPS